MITFYALLLNLKQKNDSPSNPKKSTDRLFKNENSSWLLSSDTPRSVLESSDFSLLSVYEHWALRDL